ncbi:hypothetical protein ABHN11_24470 [Brevibacillus centrosporus]|uniref:hypothetical protein n=1 Tax=Brevibacillus centrosporus TaxID=54910 RepID=UPI003D196FA5
MKKVINSILANPAVQAAVAWAKDERSTESGEKSTWMYIGLGLAFGVGTMIMGAVYIASQNTSEKLVDGSESDFNPEEPLGGSNDTWKTQ